MDIKELNSFKLSDAIKFHQNLNPRLWKNEKMIPKIKKQLLKIAEDFIEELGVKSLDVEDITVSGSNAAFTYTPHSDLDLHILVDMNKLPSSDVYRELFQAKKTLYNDSHDITVHGVPVELYVQDINEPVVSLGEYSIMSDSWLKIPTKRRANLDQNATKAKYERLKELINLALKQRSLERVSQTLSLIKRYRKAGLDRGGEFGPENLAFKIVRKQGLIGKLYSLRDELHSEELTIEGAYSGPKMKFLKPGELKGSYTDRQLLGMGFRKSQNGAWYIPQVKWDKLNSSNLISEEQTLAERFAKEFEDFDPNGTPPGPEFKPTMPAGTARVDVSDVYDWYKLGQHISNLKGLGKHDFGKGPPSTIISFGSEDAEHQYIDDLEKTGLTTTDIDPPGHKKMKGQKTDPTYNVESQLEEATQTFAGKDPMSFKSPNGGTPVMILMTAQGSRYLITSDGMVLRNKSAHANTGGDDQGLQSWSEAIEYYEPNEKPGGVSFPLSVSKAVEKGLPVALGKTKDGKRALLIYADKAWRVAKISDIYKNVASTDAQIVSTYSTSPKLNWNVLDYNLGQNKIIKRAHPGSPVTHGISLSANKLQESYGVTEKDFFFDYNMDPKVKKFILKNQFSNATMSCQNEVYRWAKKLVNAGFDVEIHHGFYMQDDDYDNPEGHTWLLVDGSVFDPTASQFSDHGEGEYETHEVEYGDDLTFDDDEEDKITRAKQTFAGLNEVSAKLYTDPNYYGADIDDSDMDSLPTVIIPVDSLVVYEPEEKMASKESKINVMNIMKALKKGENIPPILVRKWKNGYQVLDGHHRFFAHKLLKKKKIPVKIVPDENIEVISEISGYIPSNKEKNDSRFKTALTVDIKPNTMKKDAAKFGNKISRAGIPPQARADGKIG